MGNLVGEGAVLLGESTSRGAGTPRGPTEEGSLCEGGPGGRLQEGRRLMATFHLNLIQMTIRI